VHDVVEDRHLEGVQQERTRLVTGEGQVVVVRGHPGDEPEDARQQEGSPDRGRSYLQRAGRHATHVT
jgi:hypothetical protein